MARRGRPSEVAEIAFAFGGHAADGAYKWLWDHYPEMAAGKARGRRTNWQNVAERLSELGVQSRGGRPLTPNGVRQAWLRVCAAVERYGYERAQPKVPEQAAVPTPEVTPFPLTERGKTARSFLTPTRPKDGGAE